MPNPHFPKLNDANYVDWHYMMAATLIEKDLWDVVDSSLTRPVSSPNHKAMKTFVKKQQLAHAKIILSIEASQLPHTRHDDPKAIWDSLQKVHWACGFATHLSLRRCFLYMCKQDDQPVVSWVSDIKKTAFQLEATGIPTIDEDIILALTEGLPESFSAFIIALDSLPPRELTLDNVVTRLLNEEVRQTPTSASTNTSADPTTAPKLEPVAALLTTVRGKCLVSEITCYRCGGKGHYKSDCPSPEAHAATMGNGEGEDGAW